MAPQSVEWLKGPILMLGSLMAQIKTDPGREMHQQQVAATAVDEALQMLCALAGPSKDPLLGLIHTGLCGQHLQREPLGNPLLRKPTTSRCITQCGSRLSTRA